MTGAKHSRVVIVDGRSGSGKTTLADRIAGELSVPGASAQVLHLDDLYPGWHGLSEGSRAVAMVLQRGHYRPYDWATGEFSGPRITLDSNRPLVIEGCGALTDANLAAAREWAAGEAVRAIWIDCDEALRRARALARDGGMFAPHWDEWASQEDAHFALHEPWKLADEILCNE